MNPNYMFIENICLSSLAVNEGRWHGSPISSTVFSPGDVSTPFLMSASHGCGPWREEARGLCSANTMVDQDRQPWNRGAQRQHDILMGPSARAAPEFPHCCPRSPFQSPEVRKGLNQAVVTLRKRRETTRRGRKRQ